MGLEVRRSDRTNDTSYVPVEQDITTTTSGGQPSTTTTTQPATAGTTTTVEGAHDANLRFNSESGANQRMYLLQTGYAPAALRGPSDSSGENAEPVEPPQSIPQEDLPQRIDIEAVKNGSYTPTAQELVDHINALRKIQGRSGDEATIPSDDAEAFGDLTAEERRFFAAVLYEQDKILVDKDPNARRDYQYNVMQHAADIAGNDGKKFINLVQAAFSAPEDGYGAFQRYGRGAAGTGAHRQGQYLESAFSRTDDPASDYNPVVRDKDDNSTVTHHFGEFLKAHGVGWKDPYDLVEMNDDKKKNPGDVRSGFFAVMLGDGLRNGDITPQQAVDLTRWAYSIDPGGTQGPPWGSDGNSTGYLSQDDYKGKLDDWVRAYDEAHA
jgi:hypothetical protein